LEKVSTAQKEIEKKRRLPRETKRKIDKTILHNLLICVGMMLSICVIGKIYIKSTEELFTLVLKIFSIIIIIKTVVIFEMAYRKDSLAICVNGIEFLIFGIIIIYMKYMYLHGTIYKIAVTLSPIFFAIYYLSKSIVIYKKIKADYIKNLSDIKEIVKVEKESHLDENSTKILKKKEYNKGKKI